MKKIILILMLAPLLLASTCEQDAIEDNIACTEIALSGLSVKVNLQNATLIFPTGINVVAKEGIYVENLISNDINFSDFSGAIERKGNYIITVSKSGYKTYTSSQITVKADRCHVIQQKLNVVLIPE